MKIKSVKVRDLTFTSDYPKNTARLNDGSIIFINKILLRDKEQLTQYKLSDLFFLVHTVTKTDNFFKFLTLEDIRVDIINDISNALTILPMKNIKRKCTVLQVGQEKCAIDLLYS